MIMKEESRDYKFPISFRDLPVNTLTAIERLNWSHDAYGLDKVVWMKFLIKS